MDLWELEAELEVADSEQDSVQGLGEKRAKSLGQQPPSSHPAASYM